VFELAEALGAEKPERPANLTAVIESLLFVAEEPPSVHQLAEATNVSKDAVEAALEALEAQAAERGLHVQRHGATVRLVSAPESARWVQRFLGLERPNKLSKAALETLAIIVYRQPVTRLEVEKVRGVGCDGPFHTLRMRELIEPVGQAEGPGRPNLWGVTQFFLDHFGLKGLDELPPLPDLRPTEQGKLSLEKSEARVEMDPEADPEAAEPIEAEAALAVEEEAPIAEEAPSLDEEPEDEADGDLGEYAAAGGSGA
jgi:segregation and condensation protein B